MKRIILLLISICFLISINAQTEKPQKKMNELVALDRYAEENSKLPAPIDGEKRVVFIGNSITRGWVREHRAFFTDNNYVGRGIGGQSSLQILLRFQQDVVSLKPYAVVISAGTNDVAENTGPYNPVFTLDNIKSMSQIAEANGIKVILSSVLPVGAFRWNKEIPDASQRIDKLNIEIKAYAESKGFSYIDYNTPMRDKNGALKPNYGDDGVHPNIEGYKVMESVAKPVIDKVLAQ